MIHSYKMVYKLLFFAVAIAYAAPNRKTQPTPTTMQSLAPTTVSTDHTLQFNAWQRDTRFKRANKETVVASP